MELHRNSMELHMPIFYGEIIWKFLWNFPVGLNSLNHCITKAFYITPYKFKILVKKLVYYHLLTRQIVFK
jgi:hypothetical protein